MNAELIMATIAQKSEANQSLKRKVAALLRKAAAKTLTLDMDAEQWRHLASWFEDIAPLCIQAAEANERAAASIIKVAVKLSAAGDHDA